MRAEQLFKGTKANVFRFAYFLLAILLLLSFGFTFVFYQTARTRDAVRFQTEVNRLQSAIDHRLNLYYSLLNGGRGFIESASYMNQQKFAQYVESLDLPTNYPGIRAIGFVKTVRSDEAKTFSGKMAADGNLGFSIFPATQKEVYYPLLYVAPPTEQNLRAIGFDLSSDAYRLEVLNRARDAGKITSSGKWVPIIDRENNREPVIAVFFPIYKIAEIPPTQEAKQTGIHGFLYTTFLPGSFLTEIVADTDIRDVAVKLYDGEKHPDNFLAQFGDQAENFYITIPNETFSQERVIEVGGRKWIIEYTSLPLFIANSRMGWTPLVLFGGVCFSFLIFGFGYLEASSRRRLQKSAAELFKLQKENEELFEQEKRSRIAAEQASRAKGEFVEIVSHELRTPLNTIAGWARILDTHEISHETKETALNKINKNLRLQEQLIEQLLSYSDIISQDRILARENVNFSEIVESSLRELGPMAEKKNIDLQNHNRLYGIMLNGDAAKLKIAVDNLLSNAIKFTPQNGTIETRIFDTDGFIHFEVKDSGRGITDEFLPYLFEHYMQADAPHTRAYGGLGLGLAITKHIIELHNGNLHAASEGTGKGSVFTVKIPREKKEDS